MPVERVPRADLQKVAHDIESGGGLITAITTDDGYFVIAWIKRPEGAPYETRVSDWISHPWAQQILAMKYAEDAVRAARLNVRADESSTSLMQRATAARKAAGGDAA